MEKKYLEKQHMLSHITVCNVSDDLLLSDSKSIKDIMNKELEVQLIIFYRNVNKKVYLFVEPLWLWKVNISWFFNKITC